MEALKEIIPLIFAASLFALVLAVGLDSEIKDLLALFRQPSRLFKAILAVNIVVPLAAVLLIALFPVSLVTKAAVLIMAISPVPPLVPGKQLKIGGEKEYSYALYTALILLAVLVVPISLAILNAVYGTELAIPIAAVVRNVALTVVVPLILGLIVGHYAPAAAGRAASLLRKVAMLLLVLAFVPVLIGALKAFAPLVGDGTLVLMALVSTIALLGGHLLGGPDPQDRAVLAVTAATRHPGIALMIVKANTTDPRFTAAILGYLLVSLVVAIPYQVMMKRRLASAAAAV